MSKSNENINPFPGLRPFEASEYRLFFGREGQSDALIARLQRSRFLAVVGTSGSGKSSLVRAGLLPALRGGMMAGAGSAWRICIMRPGSDPIGNLALALADKDVLLAAGAGLSAAEAEAVIEATLRRGALGLVDAVRQARLEPHEKLMVVVDQFEELFRFRAARAASSTGDDAAAFVKLLLEAAQQSELPIYVVPTMRSDFLGDCAQFQGLPEAINDGQYLIPRMTRDERRFAITGPVGVTRGKITEPLVNRLMNDVGDNPDQLPILQHALMRTWDYWKLHRRNGEPIGLEHYEAIGTMSEALSEHADEAFSELPDERSRLIAERLFKALTERGADNREIRRPTSLKDICAIANASPAEVGAVIDVFRAAGRSFLMPSAGVALTPETVIDISHESLIRNWDRLQAWVKDEAESARIYRRLAGAATDYHQGVGGLLDDVTLQYVLKWQERSKPTWHWGVRYHPEYNTAMSYLELSTASRDARIEAEQERERKELETAQAFAQKQARSAKRLRWLTAGMAVMFMLALAAAAWGFGAQRTATRLKDAAERSAKDAKEAQARAVRSEGVAKQEKDNAVQSAKTAREAEVSAEKEKVKAEKSAQVAKEAQAKAEKSKKDLQASNALLTNEKKNTVDALDRSGFNVQGSAAFQREDYSTALRDFGSALAILHDEQERQGNNQQASLSLADARISLLSNLGATLRKVGESDNRALADAVASYECARSLLLAGGPTRASADPNAPCNLAEKVARRETAAEMDRQKTVKPEELQSEVSDWAMFDLYYGAGQAYRDLAASLREGSYENRRARAGNVQSNSQSSATPDPDVFGTFQKAAQYFQQALKIQEKRLDKTDRRIAAGYQELASVYLDNDQIDQAETALKRAVELRRLNNEPSGLTAALRELAKFYAEQSNFPAAAHTYNELIDIQDQNVSVYDVPGLNDLTDSYSELAQLYSAQNDPAKAGKAFKVAGLLQYVALASRKYQVNKDVDKSQASKGAEKIVLDLAYQLDQLGDAYIQLDRFAQAEETYNGALEVRGGPGSKDAWRSYERLGNMFYNQIKDKDYAKNISNKDYVEAYNKAKEYYFELVGSFEPPPTDDVLKEKFGEGLERLARLEANDPGTYDAAETKLTTALGIRRQRADWKGEFSTLSALVDLYRRENKQPKIDETYETWLASMNKYIKLYARPNPVARAWPGFLTAYMQALTEIGESYLSRKMNTQAEAVYAQAFAYSPVIRGRSFDTKVLEMYATALEKYESLLQQLNKPAESAKVRPEIESVRNKLDAEKSRQANQNAGQQAQQSKEP
jgi:energy-coupling factor transporter ATP-binding protein EcfA2